MAALVIIDYVQREWAFQPPQFVPSCLSELQRACR